MNEHEGYKYFGFGPWSLKDSFIRKGFRQRPNPGYTKKKRKKKR